MKRGRLATTALAAASRTAAPWAVSSVCLMMVISSTAAAGAGSAAPLSTTIGTTTTRQAEATTNASSAVTTTVTDDAGHAFTTTRPIGRIVALAPHLTELVYAAGGGDKLVAVTRFSDYPAAARALPQVGDAFAINFEAIVALKPDLILAWHSGLAQRQRERLESLGLPVFDSQIDSVEGISSTLRRLGTLMHTSAVADPVAEKIDTRWRALAERFENRPPVRVFYQVASEPLMTVNGRHLVSRTITACGGTNAFADLPTLVPTVTWEAAARSNPQLIALAAPSAQAAGLGHWPSLSQVDAVRHGQFAELPPTCSAAWVHASSTVPRCCATPSTKPGG